MSDKQALVVSYHVVQPDRDSGARRIFQLIELLQELGWAVTFLASDGAGDSHDVRLLQHRGVAVYDGQYTDIRDVLAAESFQLALVAFWRNAERHLPAIRRLSPGTRVIVDSIDLHFVREARRAFSRLGNREPTALTSTYASAMAGELNVYASADAVMTVSQEETGLLGTLLGGSAPVYPVPDFEDDVANHRRFESRRGVVCAGSFQHPPNVEAVEYLCRQIVPQIDPALLDEHPIWIIGNGLDDRVRAFGRDLPQVRMVGWVPSVLPYFGLARVSVVPLLYGAGTKRKLIQALVAGTPTVSTTIGIEGLGVRAGEHVLVADDSAEFAEGVTRLLTDEELWNVLSQAGRQHVSGTNSRGLARKQLVNVLESVFATDPTQAVVAPADASSQDGTADDYRNVVAHVRGAVTAHVPADAHVLVVSRGDDLLLDLGRKVWHFPRHHDGRWAGYHPATSADALEHLAKLQTMGADHLVFPKTSLWWLDHYVKLAEHLRTQATLVQRDEYSVIYRLAAGRQTIAPRHEMQSITLRGAGQQGPDSPASGSPTEEVRLVAFYLPQFHPIPENDLWWGEGFTEWHNVARADPLFPGHYQPHVPADLGFYDLRLPETRHEQAELARAYGLYGFCYYHYWFDSKILLGRPFAEVLASGEPDFPFCLCWANDPWSRRWDGRTDELLQAQAYGPDDDLAHIRWLLPALADRRAITVEGRPMFLVYRGSHLPDPERTTDTWRHEVDRAGLPGIHLVAVETAWELGWDATRVGFDAKVLFQPQFGWLLTHATKRGARIEVAGKDQLQVYDYTAVSKAVADIEPVAYRRYESVFPGWDNTPRVGDRAVVMHNSGPAEFGNWLERAVEKTRVDVPDHRLVFINAWNEWAEGCHLEPDLRHGHAYLEATARALAPIAPSR